MATKDTGKPTEKARKKRVRKKILDVDKVSVITAGPKTGYVIGNGLSRKGFDLKKLDDCVTVGCNSLYKDYSPSYLVAIDRNMIDSPVEAIEKLVAKKRTKKNPRKWKYITQMFVPFKSGADKGFWWMSEEGEPLIEEVKLNRGFCHNTGMYGALLLSQVKKFETIYLIGIDFFRPTPDGVNDIYGGSFESDPGLIKVWNHMFAGAPSKSLTGEVDKDGNPEFKTENLINTKFIRVGPIEDVDREFYNTEFQNLEFIEDFADMPICPE